MSSGISLKKLCPFCNRRPSVSTNPSKRSRPLIWAEDCASSGRGGVIVSQNRMKRASVSALIPTSRSRRWTCRVSRSSLRVKAASIRSDPSGDKNDATAASTMAERADVQQKKHQLKAEEDKEQNKSLGITDDKNNCREDRVK